MRFGSRIALSIVTCGLLLEAQNYNDWTNTNFSNSNNVTIDYGAQNPPTPLNTGLTVNGGTTRVNVSGNAPASACGYVACWNGDTSLNGSGTLFFSINSPNNTLPAFTIKSGTLTTTAELLVTGARLPNTIFEAQGNANLTFNGGLTISANTNTTAIKTNGGQLNLNQSGGANVQITGNLNLNGTSNIKLDDRDTITGSLTSSGSTTLNLTNSSINGDSTVSGTKLTAMLLSGSTIGNLTSTATINQFNTSNSSTQNLSFTGQNTIQITTSSRVNGTLTTKAQGKQTSIWGIDSTINKIVHSGLNLGMSLNNAIINQGIIADNTTQIVSITAQGTSQINGNSTLSASGGGNQLIMKDTARGENFTFNGGGVNNLFIDGTNTLTNVSMQGQTTTNALQLRQASTSITINQNLLMNGAKNQILNQFANSSFYIKGDANLTATTSNMIAISAGSGKIDGTLTTQGQTTLSTGIDGVATIGNGFRHSNGNLTAIFGQNSKIDNGITTSGQGTSKITLNNSTQLNGNSNLGSNSNEITLTSSAQINGNTTFSGTTANTLSASTDSTITGGINTNTGAGKTTATFSNSSKLQNGTSTFHANIDITFANTSKAINEIFNIAQGVTNITFKDSAQMQGGSINNNGGNTTITFTGNSAMTGSTTATGGTITTSAGTTTLTANTSASLTGTLNQTGGDFTATFSNNSTFTGDATQTGGTSIFAFNDASKWTGSFNQSGADSNSTITFSGTANMEGNITTNNGVTNITFNDGTKIVGNIEARGDENNVTFTHAELDGNLTLDGMGATLDGDSTVNLTDSKVTGYIKGYDKVDLTLTRTEVDGYLFQSGSYDPQALKANISSSWIKQGFQGMGSSNNTMTIDNSKIENGVSQNTGTLDLTATKTIFTGGFSGTDSANILRMASGDFSSGDITQSGGTLKADVVSMKTIGDFSGSNNSSNIVHLMDTTLQSISQDSGSLTFRTDSNVTGNISGTNASTNEIRIAGADVGGTISQNTGEMDLYLINTNITNTNANTPSISATNAVFELYASTATVAGGISFTSSNVNGVSSNLTLNGGYTQTNGTSNLTFTSSQFQDTITVTNATQASLIFTKSAIHDINVTKGKTAFNLTNSTMENFTGKNGSHSVTLTNSTAGTFTQRNGVDLTVNAASGSKTSSISGNFTALSVSLGSSTVDGTITNVSETTTISAQDSTVTGNVQQTAGSLNFNANSSKVQGHYSQTDGVSMFNFADSSIEGGVDFLTLQSGTLIFSQKSSVKQGFSARDSRFALMFLGDSSLMGGFQQSQGIVAISVDGGSSIDGDIAKNLAGLTFSDGTTSVTAFNNSEINDGIKATNNSTLIVIDHSSINGNITIEGGEFDITAQNNSIITSNQMQVTDAYLKLTLDTSSRFEGNLTQTNNTQEITIKQESTFNGNITNIDTDSTIHIQNATLDGDLTQTGGTLKLDLSNKGIITNNVELNNVSTSLSGSGTDNAIQGNFTQNNGAITGSMNGLTLKGIYSQNGGNSSVSFTNSAFEQETKITDATSSSLTFNHSTLKDYTVSGGDQNTLKLINSTTMTGNLTLKNSATTILAMDTSRIEGNLDASGDSFLSFSTFNSQITGTTNINTGGLMGTADSTTFGGNFTLTDTTSDVTFTNATQINGDITATGNTSNNTIKFDSSSMTGSLSQTDGNINLDLSNTSSIEQDLIFTTTTAQLTGSGAGNLIGGKFDSISSNLTGDISGLTLAGAFTQRNGTSNITFRDNSHFNGVLNITDATSSNLKFINQSGIHNAISITGGTNNNITLSDNSTIDNANTTISNTLAMISASSASSIISDITSQNSISTLYLTNSTFQGNITQTQGSLALIGNNTSTFNTPQTTISQGTTTVTLNTSSTLLGAMSAENSTLNFNINNSSVGELGNPLALTLTDSILSITAKNNSTFYANITDTSNTTTAPLKTTLLSFDGNSTYNGEIALENIDTTATFTSSTLNSDNITITNGSLSLDYQNSSNGGIIQNLRATNTDLKITTSNSNAIINNLTISDNTLELIATNNARLTAGVTLNNGTKATYTAQTNGNLNVNTSINNQASTLNINIEGGILQGSVTQDVNGTGGFSTGELTLRASGGYGGRFAVTDETQLKSLSLENDESVFRTNALFAQVFNNPMTYVDFTLDFDDTTTTSRVGKEMIVKPAPQGGNPIPPAPNGQTYVRQLQLNTLLGNNGLFRVYADLGAGLADNVLAQQANGDHIIQVQYRAETFQEIGDQRIVVAKVIDPTSQVSFKGTQSDVGLTRYDTEIIKENSKDGQGFEWIIGQATPAGISHSSKIIASILQSQYRNFSVEIDSLDRRLGDLKYIKRDLGVWMRAYIGEGKQETRDFSIASADNYYSVWGGVDFNSLGLTVHNFAGLFFNYTAINTTSKDYTAKGYNVAFGLYNTFKAFSGFYADVLAKYIYSSNSFEISNYSLASNSPSLNNHKFLLNAEIGYSFYYGEKGKSGYIEPQFQVTSGYIDRVSLEMIDVSGETIGATMARNFPINLRAGVFWGQVFGEKIKSHIKLGSSFAYDVNSGGNLDFTDSSTQLQFKQEGDFRMLLSAQTDFTFGDYLKMYASFDTSFFGNYNIIYSANFGIRMTFGRANNRVRNVPSVYNPNYTPPVAINDDQRTVPVVKRYTTKDIDQNYVGKPRKVESYIQGNMTPTNNQVGTSYPTPSRQSIRDITEEVSF